MAEFPGLPEDVYEYRNEFTYSTWTPGTRVTFVNVPWDSAYRDIVSFASDSARNAYFASLKQAGETIELTGMSYLRYGEPVRVNLPFAAATRFNYLIVENPVMPVPTKPGYASADVFHYFILDASYVAPNTTMLNVQLDVWQTYGNRCTFDRCYVERGHIGIANSNSTRYNMADYLTDVEGLEIGNEYEVVHQEYVNLSVWDNPDEALLPYVVFMCTADLRAGVGTLENPSLNTSKADTVEGMVSGLKVYCTRGSQGFIDVMDKLSDAPWITQCISYITVVPETMINLENLTAVDEYPGLFEVGHLRRDQDVRWISNVFENFAIPDRYRNVLKLLTSPYCTIEMTYQCGGEVVLKPECMRVKEDGTSEIVTMYSIVPPDVRMVVFPRNYNAPAGAQDVAIRNANMAQRPIDTYFYAGEGLDFALTVSDFPQLAIANNMYLYYLASNRNQIAYQYSAADWGQQKAMMAAQIGYNQATFGMDVMGQRSQVQQNYNNAMLGINQTQLAYSTAIDAASSIAGGIGTGNPAEGIAAGLASIGNAVVKNEAMTASTAQQNSLVSQNTRLSQSQVGYNRDTNYDYATAAAQGDYEVAIQGIQAKVQDAKMTQPTTSGQMGGNIFNYVNGYNAILFKWKRIKPNFMRQVGDFFLRYGYYVNRWLVPPANLRCCENFTYWKMQQVALSTTEVPEVFKQAIRGIFEKGVTVWSDPRKMWKIELDDNEPVGGVSY